MCRLEECLDDVVDVERALALRSDSTSRGASEGTAGKESFVYIVRRGELVEEVLKRICETLYGITGYEKDLPETIQSPPVCSAQRLHPR